LWATMRMHSRAPTPPRKPAPREKPWAHMQVALATASKLQRQPGAQVGHLTQSGPPLSDRLVGDHPVALCR
jgi:hypothetical protein